MKKIILVLILLVVSGIIGWWIGKSQGTGRGNPITIIKPRTLDKYTIENLSQKTVPGSAIKVEKVLKENKEFTSSLFSFSFDPTLEKGENKKVTGVINIPKKDGTFPIVVMFRGYVDQKIYQSGVGTKKAGEVFVKDGFITIAPDFLGYGESDTESSNIFESRFQTYTTVLTLLKSLDSIDKWDKKNIFIWGHSNGGQLALTILEITQATYPTVLWAPVSKPFPYSVLVYTDEASDSGKFLRRELAKFEETYDTDLYSLTKYLDRIKAPIQIHQGTYDDAVPVFWSNTLKKELKNLGLEVIYFKYPGADHNLNPAWDTVVDRDLAFFKKHLIKI